METQKQILSLAQGAGFIMISQNEMKKVGYYNQYIYVLQKPNKLKQNSYRIHNVYFLK